MSHIYLSVANAVFAASVNIGLPSIDLQSTLVKALVLLPLVGGFLLAREGRGNLLFEISAVLLLVLATLVPITTTTLPDLNDLLSGLLMRLPVALLLLGLAFVRDGGLRMILGLILIVVSGLILLPLRM